MQNKVRTNNWYNVELVDRFVEDCWSVNESTMSAAKNEFTSQQYTRLQWVHDAMCIVSAWAAFVSLGSDNGEPRTRRECAEVLRNAFIESDQYHMDASSARLIQFMRNARNTTIWEVLPQPDWLYCFPEWCESIASSLFCARSRSRVAYSRIGVLKSIARKVHRMMCVSKLCNDSYASYRHLELRTLADVEAFTMTPINQAPCIGCPAIDITWGKFLPAYSSLYGSCGTATGLYLLVACVTELYSPLVDDDPNYRLSDWYNKLVLPFPVIAGPQEDSDNISWSYPTLKDLQRLYHETWED